jgi:DNA-binding winged helix-turn-helix (wHTH) protein
MEVLAEQQEAAKFRFGVFEADLKSGELRKSGIRIRIQAQPFRVLTFLLERPGEVVSRDELHQCFWSANTIVDMERSLATAIHKIRECLDDTVVNPRFIETLPRIGYRFIAPVAVIAAIPLEKTSVAEPVPLPPAETQAKSSPTPEPRATVIRFPEPVRFWAALAIIGVLGTIAGYFVGRHGGGHMAIPPHISQMMFSDREIRSPKASPAWRPTDRVFISHRSRMDARF